MFLMFMEYILYDLFVLFDQILLIIILNFLMHLKKNLKILYINLTIYFLMSNNVYELFFTWNLHLLVLYL